MYPPHFALDPIPHASHEKMSAKINNDNVFFRRFAELSPESYEIFTVCRNTMVGYKTLKSQIETKIFTVLVRVVDKNQNLISLR